MDKDHDHKGHDKGAQKGPEDEQVNFSHVNLLA